MVNNLIHSQLANFSNLVNEFRNQRSQMVRQQIWTRGIADTAVLKAMAKTPRHRFVDASQTEFAYADFPLPIGFGQTISQPYIVAYMAATAQLSANDKVLEIGTGCGYEAAVLSELAQEVYTIEIIPELAESARRILSQLGYANVHVKTGNGYEGWAEHAPYDAILVTAAPPHIPEALIEQLALNGTMVIPVGTWSQDIIVVTKKEGGLLQEVTIPVRFVPMTGEASAEMKE